ncbi:uncharacterized protein LOC119719628 [Patiria miniata]|uniref:TIR domain-containing protein n=1 Tax=Patiria miniata TaxID=46514 RepID=A0A913Z064_PATMI|nr:uncharacterized protein LOC119719628 [Patiria miniata]
MDRQYEINELIESMGCHLSWPELRPIVEAKDTLRREESILAEEDFDTDTRQNYYTCTKNLQGFIAYHLNKFDDALSFFHDVLRVDKRNINALGNLAFVHKKLCQMKSFQEYRNKLTDILSKACYAEKGRAYADKAYAIRNFEQFKRCFRYMRFIERALRQGRNCEVAQRAEWLFDYALALYRRDGQMLYLKRLAKQADFDTKHSELYSDDRIMEGFKAACRFFLEVIRTSPSPDYQALSWVFIGILVNHDPEHRIISSAFPDVRTFREARVETADHCFQRGLAIHPEHFVVIRRVGTEYVKLGRYEEARDLLDRSLRKRKSHFAYRYRAVMYLTMYEELEEKDKGTLQSRQLLRVAKRDYKKALSWNRCHADYSDLGYVYYLLGEREKALTKFLQATKAEQDDYFEVVSTHKRWAQCLKEAGEKEGSQMQKEEAERVRAKILESPLAEKILGSDDITSYKIAKKPGYVRIIEDYHLVEPPSSSSRQTRTDCKYPYDCFVWHAERDSRWTDEFVRVLETKYNLSCCLQSRDLLANTGVFDGLSSCLGGSYKLVIILTPHPSPLKESDQRSEGWESFVIEQGLQEGVTRVREGEYILPIRLLDCPLPEKLQDYKNVIECEDGQILTEDLSKLVLDLTKNAKLSGRLK